MKLTYPNKNRRESNDSWYEPHGHLFNKIRQFITNE
jgi:hypothetical protein